MKLSEEERDRALLVIVLILSSYGAGYFGRMLEVGLGL